MNEQSDELEPHGWAINITCPRCGHVGDAYESFPCCEHVAEIRAKTLEECAAAAERRARHLRYEAVGQDAPASELELLAITLRSLNTERRPTGEG